MMQPTRSLGTVSVCVCSPSAGGGNSRSVLGGRFPSVVDCLLSRCSPPVVLCSLRRRPSTGWYPDPDMDSRLSVRYSPVALPPGWYRTRLPCTTIHRSLPPRRRSSRTDCKSAISPQVSDCTGQNTNLEDQLDRKGYLALGRSHDVNCSDSRTELGFQIPSKTFRVN
jgi:hypothetical protein